MIPGPDLIYKCPHCGNFLKNSSLLSGNTFCALLYSDGKQVARMLPEFPNLTKCKKCDSIFWLSEIEEIGECEWSGEDNIPQDWKNAPFAEFLSINDLFRALTENSIKKRKTLIRQIAEFLSINDLFRALTKNSIKKRETLIRQMIWQKFNDRVRVGKDTLFVEQNEKDLWESNCNALINLLNINNNNQKIMIAELYRNIGQFEKCLKIINELPDDFDWLKEQFKAECESRNQLVFLLV
jgi:hypothetical protein